MTKQVMSVTIDERIIGTIDTLSKQKFKSKSSVVEDLLISGLRFESDLKPDERYHFGRSIFMQKCKDLLKLRGILSFEGGVIDHFSLIFTVFFDQKSIKNRKTRYSVSKLTVFELLNELKVVDNELFQECLAITKRNKKIYDEYVQIATV